MANPTWNDVMNFELPENPIIFDLGGYKGEWTSLALEKFVNPTIYIFEPVEEFYNIIRNKYGNTPNIHIFKFGLADQNKSETIYFNGDATSLHQNNGNSQEIIALVDIIEFINQQKISKINLAKINIEGAEYDLLERLTDQEELNIFDNILVQFHSFIPNCVSRRENIQNKLKINYTQLFNYEFIFEAWSRNKK